MQILHIAGEIVFRKRPSEARVEALFLRDARDRQTAIIMGRVEQTILGQAENLQMHGAVKQTWALPFLEIGASAAADQQTSPVNAMLCPQHISHAAIRVSGGRSAPPDYSCRTDMIRPCCEERSAPLAPLAAANSDAGCHSAA